MMIFGRLLGAAGALLFLYVLTIFVASEAGGKLLNYTDRQKVVRLSLLEFGWWTPTMAH